MTVSVRLPMTAGIGDQAGDLPSVFTLPRHASKSRARPSSRSAIAATGEVAVVVPQR